MGLTKSGICSLLKRWSIITQEVETLRKGLEILKLLVEHPNLTIPQIIATLGFNQSSTYRLVGTLEQQQFITRNKHNQYTIADGWLRSSRRNTPVPWELNWKSVPPMQELNEATHESIYVGILKGGYAVTTQALSGRYATHTHSAIGAVTPLYGSAIGKCILAYQETQTQVRLVEGLKFETFTPNTITNYTALWEELQRIHSCGYAVDNEETEFGVRCIAAPIRKNGKVFAAVAVSGPSARIAEEKDAVYSRLVIACADQISAELTEEQ